MSKLVFLPSGSDGAEARIDIAVVGAEAFQAYAAQPPKGRPRRLDALIIMTACQVWAEFNEKFPLLRPSAPVDTPEFNAELLDQMAVASAKIPGLDEAKELGATFRDLALASRSAASGRTEVLGVDAFLAGLRLGRTAAGSRETKEQRLARQVLARSRKAQDQRLKPVRERRKKLVDEIRTFAINAIALDPSISDAEIGRRFRKTKGLELNTTSNNEAKIIRQLRKDRRLQEDS